MVAISQTSTTLISLISHGTSTTIETCGGRGKAKEATAKRRSPSVPQNELASGTETLTEAIGSIGLHSEAGILKGKTQTAMAGDPTIPESLDLAFTRASHQQAAHKSSFSLQGERRAYDPRPARPRSRERSPHRQAHPRQDHSERYQPHATAQPAAPEHRHRPESGRVHQQQRGPGGQSRVEEGRVSHVATPAAHAAINAGSAAQQTDRQPGRNSWGQQANRGRPDPFAGGGKWKHDGFEELQKQPDEGAKETADITLGTAVVT
ncbi:hypothetical protein WJX73_007887 [Symbiochloris irregularis]|uniref:Uncharacterized protein n=1 Tax=Symbiochloris irregularis TaxID=706552 RepID=A0AAW1PIX7_9CHLO